VKLIYTNETSDDEDDDIKEDLQFQVNIFKAGGWGVFAD
jgi:hypothetical protein